MKSTYKTFLVMALSAAGLMSASGQNALSKAKSDLQKAQASYEATSNALAKEEVALIREVEDLDDEVFTLTKEYSKLVREKQYITNNKSKLETLLEKRAIEFKFHNSVFDRYLRDTQNKVQAAEVQVLNPQFDTIQASIDASGSSMTKRVEASLPMLNAGVDRLLNLAGGAKFSGKAQSDSAKIVEGEYAIFGPVAYFLSNDGEVAGVTNKVSGGVVYPSIQEGGKQGVDALIKSGKSTVVIDGSLGKAYNLKKAKKGFKEYLDGGGVVGLVIVGLGVVAILIAILKAVEINLFAIPSRREINEFLDAKLDHNEQAAQTIINGMKGLTAEMVISGNKYFYSKRRILEDALYEKFSAIPPRLERGLPFLSLVAASAPMLGLLGTVLGIMKTFALMSEGGSSNIKFISGGISEALITTFMGLAVAIPILLLHGFLKGMAKGKSGEAEGVAMSIINGTSELKKAAKEEVEIEDLVPNA